MKKYRVTNTTSGEYKEFYTLEDAQSWKWQQELSIGNYFVLETI